MSISFYFILKYAFSKHNVLPLSFHLVAGQISYEYNNEMRSIHTVEVTQFLKASNSD